MKLKHQEGLIYVGIWILVFCLCLLHALSDLGSFVAPSDISRVLFRVVRALLPYIVIFSVSNYILIPKLLFRHKVSLYVVWSLILIAVMAVVQYFEFLHHTPPLFDEIESLRRRAAEAGVEINGQKICGSVHGFHRIPMPYIHDVIYSFLVIGANMAISLTVKQLQTEMDRKKTAVANMESQLTHLKAQINPHFYMNMLNNIHGLIEIDPARAQEMVYDMSQLMRYMLYDSELPRISLVKEVDFLKDYIRLMQQRYPQGKVDISVSFPDSEQLKGIEIPPLLFIVFLENAFKHGVSFRKNSFVALRLRIDGKRLNFHCINSKLPKEESSTSSGGNGIGLVNERKRLALIYGDDYELLIKDTPLTYIVNLSIPIYETENAYNR